MNNHKITLKVLRQALLNRRKQLKDYDSKYDSLRAQQIYLKGDMESLQNEIENIMFSIESLERG